MATTSSDRKGSAIFFISLLCSRHATAMHLVAIPVGIGVAELAAVGTAGAGVAGLAAAEVGMLEAGLVNAWNPLGWLMLGAAAVGGVALGIAALSPEQERTRIKRADIAALERSVVLFAVAHYCIPTTIA